MTDSTPPETPLLDAWYEAHDGVDVRDVPVTHLWMPRVTPYANLQTIARGCDKPDVLADPARPMVNLHLGDRIAVGGYLNEIEAYLDAAREALRLARWQADEIAKRMAEEADDDVTCKVCGTSWPDADDAAKCASADTGVHP